MEKFDAKHSIDPPSLIRMCLNCKRPRCIDCIKDFDKEKLMQLRKGGDAE